MSLRTAAQHLAAQGRNGDTQLIHMTPGEVNSLQALAKAHGGSLTINPQTGLAEAGFLSSLLPAAAGFALNAAFPGLGALGSAALVGGASYLSSGSLTRGLMTGLGAYGGAALGSGVTSEMLTPEVVTSEAGQTAGSNVATAASEEEMAKQAAQAAQAAQTAEAAKAQAATEAAQKEAANYTSGADYSTAGTKYAGTGEGLQGVPAQQAPASPYSLTPPTTDYSLKPAPVTSPTQLPNAVPGPKPTLMETLKQNATRKNLMMAAAPTLLGAGQPVQPQQPPARQQIDPQKYTFERGAVATPYAVDPTGVERNYFPGTKFTRVAASGGAIRGYADGGMPITAQNPYYPQAGIQQGQYANAWQTPMPREMLASGADTGVNPMTGQMSFAKGGVSDVDRSPMQRAKGLRDMPGITDTAGLYASGGLSDLGSYSDGGRLLRGPGDGVSDSIPAVIGRKQPARLADGEFVVPARIVSEIGNGSTEAGARKLYAMMDRVQKARGKTVGKGRVAKNTRADRYLPA